METTLALQLASKGSTLVWVYIRELDQGNSAIKNVIFQEVFRHFTYLAEHRNCFSNFGNFGKIWECSAKGVRCDGFAYLCFDPYLSGH